jgi:hypothetical protein
MTVMTKIEERQKLLQAPVSLCNCGGLECFLEQYECHTKDGNTYEHY